jgi:hypothetical protein
MLSLKGKLLNMQRINNATVLDLQEEIETNQKAQEVLKAEGIYYSDNYSNSSLSLEMFYKNEHTELQAEQLRIALGKKKRPKTRCGYILWEPAKLSRKISQN